MIELRARLQKSDLEKEELKMQIRELFDEKDNTQRHLEAISQAHESRITEMHCVIVELNKKLKVQQDTAIIEETEPEGSGEIRIKPLKSRLRKLSPSFRIELSRGLGVQLGDGDGQLRPERRVRCRA